MIEYIKSPDPFYRIEAMKITDREGVIDVFNYFIENSYATFFTERTEYDLFGRFMAITRNFPSVVITIPNGKIVGFAFMHKYHPAPALSKTAEITYFIMPEHTGKKLGSAILAEFEKEASSKGITQILASITSLNQGSIRFHESHGFTKCGEFKQIGLKDDQLFSVIWMQKMI